MTERLSKKQRGKIERLGPALVARSKRVQTAPLAQVEAILDKEDDLRYLEVARQQFHRSYIHDGLILETFKIYREIGVSEEELRSTLLDSSGAFSILFPYLARANRFQASRLKGIAGVMQKQKTLYEDEDDKAIIEMIREGTDISIVDLLSEKTRTRGEDVALLDIQAEWLKGKKRQERKEKMHQVKRLDIRDIREVDQEPQTIDSNEEHSLDIPLGDLLEKDKGLELEGRELFWTRRFFSNEPDHLVAVGTESRSAAIDEISQLSRGQVSIKPGSLLGALEFHLQKDVIQRALATRNKYGPEWIRDWVKIKRGDDRIFLLIGESELNRIIFFAAGRDVVYRGI